MPWATYKGLQLPDATSNDAGENLSNDLRALADRTAGTAGSVLFVGASGVATEDNAHFFFDDTNVRLGIGTASPSSTLHIAATAPTLNLVDPFFRQLKLTGPTSGDASIEVLNTGVSLQIATYTGSIYFKTNYVERARLTGNGSTTTLAVSGGIGTAVATKTAAYTLTALDSVLRGDASGGAFTLTLPTAVGCAGR